jgi:hypothetical protein
MDYKGDDKWKPEKEEEESRLVKHKLAKEETNNSLLEQKLFL